MELHNTETLKWLWMCLVTPGPWLCFWSTVATAMKDSLLLLCGRQHQLLLEKQACCQWRLCWRGEDFRAGPYYFFGDREGKVLFSVNWVGNLIQYLMGPELVLPFCGELATIVSFFPGFYFWRRTAFMLFREDTVVRECCLSLVPAICRAGCGGGAGSLLSFVEEWLDGGRVGLIRAFHGPAPSSKLISGTLAFLVVLVCQGYHIKVPQIK